MVLFRNAIHSALSLVATMMCLGAFYVIEQGPFLGLVQIIVYTGAIMILFLFVLMLVGRDSSDSIVETLRGQRWAAALFGARLRAARRAVGRPGVQGRQAGRPRRARTPTAATSTRSPQLLFTKYLFAFELTSALLIVAAVGAMVLAHVEREGPQAARRSRWPASASAAGRPQPLPGPGVLSTGNSIGTPALLPDGTISHESVMVGDAAESRRRASSGDSTTGPRSRPAELRATTRGAASDPDLLPGAVARRCSRSARSACSCAATRSSCSCRVELMLNAVNLSLVTFSRINGDLEGQVMAFFVMVVAAAEVVVGLAIIMSIFRTRRSASVDDANLLKY